MSRHEPCPGCPWRRSNPATGGDIPGFSIALMRGLKSTVGQGDAMRKIMACHHSLPGKETHCRGYIARHGYSNINVRLLAMTGDIEVPAIVSACAGLDLWETFDEMLAAYEAAQP